MELHRKFDFGPLNFSFSPIWTLKVRIWTRIENSIYWKVDQNWNWTRDSYFRRRKSGSKSNSRCKSITLEWTPSNTFLYQKGTATYCSALAVFYRAQVCLIPCPRFCLFFQSESVAKSVSELTYKSTFKRDGKSIFNKRRIGLGGEGWVRADWYFGMFQIYILNRIR